MTSIIVLGIVLALSLLGGWLLIKDADKTGWWR